ncbi:MAG: ABC-2 transporter permease [Ruminococcus sp.]|nr:ABC-2 transporter permease [Ruminococcus sp.]
MTKLRSLLFRELKLTRKTNILMFFLLIVMSGFYTVGIYAVKNDPESGNMAEIMVLMLSSVLSVLCSMPGLMQNESFVKDINSNWLRYSYTLPVTSKERAVVKVLHKNGGVIILMLLFYLPAVALFCHIAETEFLGTYVTVYALVYAAMMLVGMLSSFFTLSARSVDEYKKQSTRYGLTSLVVLIIAALIFYKKIRSVFNNYVGIELDKIYNFINASWLIWLIPLIILLNIADYLVIKNRMKSAFSDISVKKKAEITEAISDTHDYPTGFFYKELKQNRLSIVLVAILPLLITVLSLGMMYTVSLSEEISFKSALADGEWKLLHYICIVLGVFFASSLIMNVFSGDDNKLWAFFAASTPDGVKRFMYNKYVLCFAMTGLYMVMSIFSENLYDTIKFIITGKESSNITTVFIIIFYMLIFFNSIDIPLMFRFGQKKGSIIKTTAMLVIAIVAVIIWENIPYEWQDAIFYAVDGVLKGQASDEMLLITPICILLCLAAYPMSYNISCKLFMKGVNNYDK